MTIPDLSFAQGLPFREHTFEDTETLFSAGGKPVRLFLVAEGCIRLQRPLRSGASAIMQRARTGDWLAESSLFSDRYHCDAISQGITRTISVSKRELLAAFDKDPRRSMKFSVLLAEHLRRLRGMHEIVRVRSARDRVLHWLWLEAKGKPATLRLDQTWTQVADEIALTREAVYRAVAELKQLGIVRQRGEMLWINAAKSVGAVPK
jgi:CRP-like cAMP-binding protein